MGFRARFCEMIEVRNNVVNALLLHELRSTGTLHPSHDAVDVAHLPRINAKLRNLLHNSIKKYVCEQGRILGLWFDRISEFQNRGITRLFSVKN